MNKIVWNKRYEINIDFIDKEHKQLFATMNKLLSIMENREKGQWACKEAIKYFKNHTHEHFVHEEAYMRSIEYSEYDIHKRLHDDFRNNTLPALEKELAETDYSQDAIRHFLGVCIGWMVSHTQTEDQAIAGKRMSKWTNVPQEEEMDALEQMIVQILKNMLRLSAKIVSRQYDGEEFGKVMCYRFLYRGEKKEKQEIVLCFEEKLLLKIVSDTLNTEYLKVDDLVIDITRYISRQFIEQIRECIPMVDMYELESESLLTHEQLLHSFERIHPSCSLLFDTGDGYFAFCVTSTDDIRGKIVLKNDMSQIQKNLEGKNRKKQILVVDDSDFMRSSIIQILGDDYEVLESNSSIAAIKCIAMHRPDLILLDYEMPICDGRQALEMIRSDEDIADIPVVFLTGKNSADCVRKVKALKPEGYLLKSLPDKYIKNYIDEFFANRENTK